MSKSFNALIWEELPNGSFRSPAPFIGTFWIERISAQQFVFAISTPSSFERLIAQPFMDAGQAMKAGQEYYDAKLSERLAPDASTRHNRDIVTAACAEYRLKDAIDNQDKNFARHAAIRGMMVRLGLYREFNAELSEGKNPTQQEN